MPPELLIAAWHLQAMLHDYQSNKHIFVLIRVSNLDNESNTFVGSYFINKIFLEPLFGFDNDQNN